MHTIDKNYFPGWVRKSITFTIDDGLLEFDSKFLSYVKPAGLRGTFNLCGNREVDDVFPALYDGYEIGNHCRLHPFAMNEDRRKSVRNEPFDPASADHAYIYFDPDKRAGYYFKFKSSSYGWAVLADDDVYIDLVRETDEALVSIFGRDRVKGFVYPFGGQNNPALHQRLIDMGVQSIRIFGNVDDTTGFAMPADRMAWSYNADDCILTECSKKYEAYPDDGTLKFFCVGVHSIDYERRGTWNVLDEFCRRMANRPEDYWYACVGEIFDYEDAVGKLIVTEEKIENRTDIDLYVKVDGSRIVVRRRSSVEL